MPGLGDALERAFAESHQSPEEIVEKAAEAAAPPEPDASPPEPAAPEPEAGVPPEPAAPAPEPAEPAARGDGTEIFSIADQEEAKPEVTEPAPEPEPAPAAEPVAAPELQGAPEPGPAPAALPGPEDPTVDVTRPVPAVEVVRSARARGFPEELRGLPTIEQGAREEVLGEGLSLESLPGAEALGEPYLFEGISGAVELMRSELASGRRTFAIAGLAPGSGTSTASAVLALALASHGLRVLLVEAHAGRSALASLLQVPCDHGIAGVLRGDVGLGEALVVGEREGIAVLAREPGPAEIPGASLANLLEGAAFNRLIEDAERVFQVVILDAGAAGVRSATAAVARRSAGTILVARARGVRAAGARRTRDALRQAGARLLGAILTGTRSRSDTRDRADARSRTSGRGREQGRHRKREGSASRV